LPDNPHFLSVSDWAEAERVMGFRPLVPRTTAGATLRALRVFVRDHRNRLVAPGQRSLEAHYGAFVFSQSRPGPQESRRLALDVPYGIDPGHSRVGTYEARVCELGPEVPPDDPDGRAPAVVTWAAGDRFCLVASSELSASTLIGIARSARSASSA
jgi:hypothetical protein